MSGKNENGSLSQALASKVIHLAVGSSSDEKWGMMQDRHQSPSLRKDFSAIGNKREEKSYVFFVPGLPVDDLSQI